MIPAEAVEAAAKRIGDAVTYRDVLAILEAAAPHMLATAWEEGYLFSYDQERGGNGALPIPVPEYLADDLAQWNPYMLNNEGEK